MIKKIVMVTVMLFCMTSLDSAAHVTSITGGDIIDFSEWGGDWIHYNQGPPLQVGTPNGDDIIWSSTQAMSVIGDGVYGFEINPETGFQNA